MAEDEVPSSGKVVYLFFEFLALGFVLEGVADIVHYGGPWYRWTASFCAAILCFWIGIKRQQIRQYFAERMPNYRALHDVRSENERLRSRIEELRCQLEVLSAPKKQPDHLRVRFEYAPNSQYNLIFSTTGRKITVKRIGPLVSEETYRIEHPLIPSKSVHPEIELNRPSECNIFLPLPTCLIGYSRNTFSRNSVVVDYTDGSNAYSQCFYLTVNQDKSVIWQTIDLDEVPVGDLKKLQESLWKLERLEREAK